MSAKSLRSTLASFFAPKKKKPKTAAAGKENAAADAAPAPAPPSIGLPADALAVILSYSDLGGVAATSATSSELRDGMRALCPGLQHELLVRTVFPILSTVEWGDGARPPPRELYLSQTRLVANERAPDVVPTRGLDAYTFSLEIMNKVAAGSNGVWKSSYVGTGTVDAAATAAATINWTIPVGVWSVSSEALGIRARVMATRRGSFERALLYQGNVHDCDGECFYFELEDLPSRRDHDFLSWIRHSPNPNNVYNVPNCELLWDEDEVDKASTMSMVFQWDNDDGSSEMTVEDACLALEHWAAFSS